MVMMMSIMMLSYVVHLMPFIGNDYALPTLIAILLTYTQLSHGDIDTERGHLGVPGAEVAL